MGRRSISGGAVPTGTNRIQLCFNIDRTRFRPSLPWVPTERNLHRARALVAQIKLKIAAGTFSFVEEFPDYGARRQVSLRGGVLTCSEVFDAFLGHCQARVSRGDLAPITLASYRKILDRVWRPMIGRIVFLSVRHSTLANIADTPAWSKKTYNNAVSTIRRAFEFGYRDHPEQRNPASFLKSARIRRSDRPAIDPFPIDEAERVIAAIHRDWGDAQGNYDEFRFFTGLRPSEEIALRVSDFDPANKILSVTKARVAGLDREITKTGESRLVELCPRATAILQRQLMLREQLQQSGRLNHESLFFDIVGTPFLDSRTPYRRWRSTLRRLPIRYRKPYVARHSSISWKLMAGRNPLWVAQQHGHSPMTMLTVYAAWAQGSRGSNVSAIRRAMREPPTREPDSQSPLSGDLSRNDCWRRRTRPTRRSAVRATCGRNTVELRTRSGDIANELHSRPSQDSTALGERQWAEDQPAAASSP